MTAIRPTDQRVARVATFLCISWDRAFALPFDVLCAVDAARERIERDAQQTQEAWEAGYETALSEMSEGVEEIEEIERHNRR